MTRSRLVPVLGVGLIVVLSVATGQALQQVRITDPDIDHPDAFGFAVSVARSNAGDVVAVGAPLSRSNGIDSGAVQVFSRETGGPGAWGRVATILSNDIAGGDRFGFSVAVAPGGVAIVAGAPLASSRGIRSGAAYLFTLESGAWSQVAKLEPGFDSVASSNGFGHAVAATTGDGGPVIVVSAPTQDIGRRDSGAAYVFEPDPADHGRWREVARLLGDGEARSFFGISVAASGDTIVVGAPGVDGALPDAGAAYIFQRDRGGPGRWGLVARITGADEDRGFLPERERSPIRRDRQRDQFGTSVAISGDLVVVGAPGDNGPNLGSGSAYVFHRHRDGLDRWGQVAEITASGLARRDDHFGTSVAIAGDRVLVGSPGDDTDGDDAGAAYLFVRHQGGADGWGRVAWIRASEGLPGVWQFGRAVSVAADVRVTGVAGAPFRRSGGDSGAAYVLEDMASLETQTPAGDSFIRRNEPNRNEGANPLLRINASGRNRAVVSFVPFANVSLVRSATLVLTIAENSNNWGPEGRTVEAVGMSPFPEGNGRSAGVPGSLRTRGEGAGITWNCLEDLFIENARPDCGRSGALLPSTSLPVVHFNGLRGEVAWDVTADVMGGTFAWTIRKTDETRSGEVWYFSREGAQLVENPDLAPRLVLEFITREERPPR